MYNYEVEKYQNPISNEYLYNKQPNTNKLHSGSYNKDTVHNKTLHKDSGSSMNYKNNALRFCNDDILLTQNPEFKSLNQRLAGPPNPKTLLKTVISAPIAELDFWRDNTLINHSHINTQSRWDTYSSGYEVSHCNPIVSSQKHSNYIDVSDSKLKNLNEFQLSNEKNERFQESVLPITQCYDTGTNNTNPHNSNLQYVKEPQLETTKFHNTESYEYPYVKEHHVPNQINLMNDNDPSSFDIIGHNPEQVTSNLLTGNCEQHKAMKDYNKNLFTNNIQPNVYTRSEIIEPINSNIGISFAQQSTPRTLSNQNDEGLVHTNHDPYIFKPDKQQYEVDTISQSDVYDPRLYGYGTSYRAYTDKNIGQTRFYYDDINSIRMPNYLVRSNIDFTGYADSYGPLSDNNKYGNQNNNNIRELANQTFLNSTLQHRNELQERLMAKRNKEMWQRRKFPIRTF